MSKERAHNEVGVKLAELEEKAKAPVVHGLVLKDAHSWQDVRFSLQTHTARLVCIEEMKK